MELPFEDFFTDLYKSQARSQAKLFILALLILFFVLLVDFLASIVEKAGIVGVNSHIVFGIFAASVFIIFFYFLFRKWGKK